jgi:hypothetical protein
LRQQSLINHNPNAQNSSFSQFQPQVRAGYSRTEQNFYKNPTNSGIKGDSHTQLNNSFGYGPTNNQGNYGNSQLNHTNSQGSYNNNQPNSGGMGVLNYNAYSQK